jgi:hypothetical protein
MEREINVSIKVLEGAQLEDIRTISRSDSSSPETKKLAEAVLALNHSVQSLVTALHAIAEAGALQLKLHYPFEPF